MIYKTSKLASEISKISDIPQMVVWDILNELGYEPQELTQQGVNKWSVKVERKVDEAKQKLCVNPRKMQEV